MFKKIVIVNGEPESENASIQIYINELKTDLLNNGVDVQVFTLKELNYRQCIGCWDCWWKTPGVCRFNDDVEPILKSVIHSDLVVFSTPIIMGMYSASLKRLHDRMIPLVHPYLKIVKSECHHKKRYKSYPKTGILFEERDAMPEEIENVGFIFRRIAINMHSEVLFYSSIHQHTPKQISHEINRF